MWLKLKKKKKKNNFALDFQISHESLGKVINPIQTEGRAFGARANFEDS